MQTQQDVSYSLCDITAPPMVSYRAVQRSTPLMVSEYNKSAGKVTNEDLMRSPAKLLCAKELEQLRATERVSEDLMEITSIARRVIVQLRQTAPDERSIVQREIVTVLKHGHAHWRHKEALCDALVDGCIELWDDAREALKGLLGSEHKLLLLGALLPLLLESDDPKHKLTKLQQHMRPERQHLGSRMAERIVGAREAKR
jgi:hypothetical protein